MYFDPEGLGSVRDRLRDKGVQSAVIATPKSLPRFVFHLRCSLQDQTFHLLGFRVPDSSFVALLAQGRKKQMDLIFKIRDLLIECGGLSEDEHRKKSGS